MVFATKLIQITLMRLDTLVELPSKFTVRTSVR